MSAGYAIQARVAGFAEIVIAPGAAGPFTARPPGDWDGAATPPDLPLGGELTPEDVRQHQLKTP